MLGVKCSQSTAVKQIDRSLTGWKQLIHANAIPPVYHTQSIHQALDYFLIANFTYKPFRAKSKEST
jgi:hypothetical protein